MIFAERLRQLRGKKYSQEELAELLRVHNNTISRWESGLQVPRSRKLTELAKILDTTSAFLLGETDDPSPVKEFVIQDQTSHETSRRIASGRLIYEWGENNRLDLPDTPENRTLLAEFLRAQATGIENGGFKNVDAN